MVAIGSSCTKVLVHPIYRRVTKDGERQTLTLPLHKELDIDTIRAIDRQAARFIPDLALMTLFYRD